MKEVAKIRYVETYNTYDQSAGGSPSLIECDTGVVSVFRLESRPS